MNSPVAYIDISHNPELSRIAEEVAITKKPRELKRDNKIVAVIMPVETPNDKKRGSIKAEYEASLATLGSWKDVDADVIITQVYQAREEGSRPAERL